MFCFYEERSDEDEAGVEREVFAPEGRCAKGIRFISPTSTSNHSWAACTTAFARLSQKMCQWWNVLLMRRGVMRMIAGVEREVFAPEGHVCKRNKVSLSNIHVKPLMDCTAAFTRS